MLLGAHLGSSKAAELRLTGSGVCVYVGGGRVCVCVCVCVRAYSVPRNALPLRSPVLCLASCPLSIQAA
ncbi:hypothetical protein ACRRTK_012563 [Alexandromys fortis]